MKMKRNEFEELLNTIGVNVYYNHTTSKDKAYPPFIVYLDTDSDNVFADNKVWEEFLNIEIHIFTLIRDDELEDRMKKVLNDNEIPYNLFDVDFDETNLIWEVIYRVHL